ncbi:MAG: hypothetical protein ABIV43_01740 [Candidatus Saccharimonadales bacterium]
MFEKLGNALKSDKPDEYYGSELLAQGSSYVNIRGAGTPEESARLREALTASLDEYYQDIAGVSENKTE